MSVLAGERTILKHGPCDLIGGRPVPLTGSAVRSVNPARPAETVWQGSPKPAHVDQAVDAARRALAEWSRWACEKRSGALHAYRTLVADRAEAIAALICAETGKAMWEARAEASAMVNKVDITLDSSEHGGIRRVTDWAFEMSPTRRGTCLWRPHGVMAVVGPFNFPAHLPNGHLVPALAAGCTAVLKPSDKTPAVGQMIGELFCEALGSVGAPPGVVNVVQGAGEVASRLVAHAGIDGVLFTGSWPVGRKILEANLDRPGRIVALEMGGNNAAVILDDCDFRQAVVESVRSGFATTGQRCTCTRRFVVQRGIADRFLRALVRGAAALEVGDPMREPPVFMGPLIRAEARDAALAFFDSLVRASAEPLLRPRPIEVEGCPGGAFLSPGIARVGRFVAEEAGGPGRDAGCDVEVFGPIVRVCVVDTLDEAIEQANATRYGLAAAIFTQNDEAARRFLAEARAGCINVNTGTAGASSKLPFGGLGLSGNHRPAGSASLDYCAFPVACMVERGPTATMSPGMHMDDAWLE